MTTIAAYRAEIERLTQVQTETEEQLSAHEAGRPRISIDDGEGHVLVFEVVGDGIGMSVTFPGLHAPPVQIPDEQLAALGTWITNLFAEQD